MRTMLLSVVERCLLFGGVIFCHTFFRDENIFPLFGLVRCVGVSINGGSTVEGIASLTRLRGFYVAFQRKFSFDFLPILSRYNPLQEWNRRCGFLAPSAGIAELAKR